MIQSRTLLEVVDNSGAKVARCISVLNGFFHKSGTAGDVVVVSIRSLRLLRKVKVGQVFLGLVVKVKQWQKYKDGSQSHMQKNAIVLLNKKKQLLGTSVNGPVSRQLRSKKYMKILLLSGMLFI